MTAAEFVVKVELKDKVAPEKFSMHIDGKGGVGFTKGTATIELREQPGPVTLMTYTSDVQIGGKIAGVGQRLLESVGKMMTKQALDALDKELQARLR
jgi:carbon monoxide dehydrogenase subunit G